nr:MATE family efflux transporter [Opitutaceae bacterium]
MIKWIHELRPTLALAFPIMIGQVSQMLMGITDSIMIGNVGTVELAASSFTGAVFGVIFIGCIGLLQPGSVLVARAHGAGDEARCGAWQRHARALAWAAGAALGGLMLASLGWVEFFGQPEEVVAVMGPYYGLIAASLVPTLLFQADRQFAEAMGRPWEPLAIMLGSVGLNVLLNWVLIYGAPGVPAMGLTGAGVATLLARIVSVIALRMWLARHVEFATATRAAR